jgi:hypothetical protein
MICDIVKRSGVGCDALGGEMPEDGHSLGRTGYLHHDVRGESGQLFPHLLHGGLVAHLLHVHLTRDVTKGPAGGLEEWQEGLRPAPHHLEVHGRYRPYFDLPLNVARVSLMVFTHSSLRVLRTAQERGGLVVQPLNNQPLAGAGPNRESNSCAYESRSAAGRPLRKSSLKFGHRSGEESHQTSVSGLSLAISQGLTREIPITRLLMIA